MWNQRRLSLLIFWGPYTRPRPPHILIRNAASIPKITIADPTTEKPGSFVVNGKIKGQEDFRNGVNKIFDEVLRLFNDLVNADSEAIKLLVKQAGPTPRPVDSDDAEDFLLRIPGFDMQAMRLRILNNVAYKTVATVSGRVDWRCGLVWLGWSFIASAGADNICPSKIQQH